MPYRRTLIQITATCLVLVFNSSLLGQVRRPQSSGSQTSEFSAQIVAARALPSVVLLICDDGSEVSQGSGFFVRPGVLVTNFHVIEGKSRGIVRVAVGDKREKRLFRVARVIAFDKESDLALLNVPDARKAEIPSLPLLPDRREIAVGETIYALGNPEGLVGTISPGIVSAGIRSSQKLARLQITAPISHGSSGGPVLNTRAQVVGVAVGSIEEGQNLNFAVPASLVTALIQNAKFPDPSDELLDDIPNKEDQKLAGWTWTDLPTSAAGQSSRTLPPPMIIGPLRQGESKETASLRKLDGVRIIIEELDADALKVVTAYQLQTEIELRLRRNRCADSN